MIAVLTGDIVSSRRLPDKRKWLKRLEDVIEKKSGLSKAPKWGIFRGDGFQVELPSPKDALKLAILIRSGLKSVPELFEQGIDARIGIGIGDTGYSAKSTNESDGPAYQWSGKALDFLKDQQYHLYIMVKWPEFQESTNASLRLVNAIIDDWTRPEAEVAWLKLSEGMTQTEMARRLKITQPAVHKRMAGSHLNDIMEFVKHFEKEVPHRIKGNAK